MPSNPINEARKEEIQRIITRVLEVWTKSYFSALADVLIEDAEKKNAPKVPVVALFPESDPPPRPRQPIKEEEHDTVNVKVVGWEEADGDIDPYVVYCVKASLGKEEAVIYRRFKEFKDFHKKIGKKAKSNESKLPAPSSKFGKRNLKPEFIVKRRKELSKYLKGVAKDKDVGKSKEFRQWLGLQLEDENYIAKGLLRRTFDLAMERAKWRLWIWKTLYSFDQGDQIAKLVVEEIRRSMFYDIRYELREMPDKLQKMAMQAAYKTIMASVGTAVSAAWSAIASQVPEIKKKIVGVLETAADQLVKVRLEIKGKIKELLEKALAPVKEQLFPLLNKLSSGLATPCAEACKPLMDERLRWDQMFRDMITNDEKWEEDHYDKLCDAVKDVKDKAEEKVEEKIQEAVGKVLGDLKQHVSLEALGAIFSPVEQFHKIFKRFFKLINPKNQKHVVKVLMEKKADLIAAGADVTKINQVLDDEEQNFIWRRWWSDYEVRWEGYYIYWELYSLLGWEFYGITNSFYHLVYELEDVHSQALEVFSFKFGDFLNDAVKKGRGGAGDMKAVIGECLIAGYDRALLFARHHLGRILVGMVKKGLVDTVMGKINDFVMPLIKEGLDPLESLIVEPLNALLNLQQLVADAILETVTRFISEAIDGCTDEIVIAFGGSPGQRSALPGSASPSQPQPAVQNPSAHNPSAQNQGTSAPVSQSVHPAAGTTAGHGDASSGHAHTGQASHAQQNQIPGSTPAQQTTAPPATDASRSVPIAMSGPDYANDLERVTKLCVVGPANVGKTTFLRSLEKGDIRTESYQTTLEVLEWDGDKGAYRLLCWPLDGRPEARDVPWLKGVRGIIFIADISSREALNKARQELAELLALPVLASQPRKAPLLVLGNKKDRPGALSIGEFNEGIIYGGGGPKLNLDGRQYFLQSCSFIQGDGIVDGISWLIPLVKLP